MTSLRIGLFFCSLTSVSIIGTANSQAQYAINMSLVTCTQYLAMPPDRSRIFSAWMSGWFNQKTGYTYVKRTQGMSKMLKHGVPLIRVS
jgi:HdeA/HdeB family